MSAAERRSGHYAELRRYAQADPTGFASDIVAAGQRAIEHHTDRAVLYDALMSLQNIDLRWWRGQPEVVAAVRAARRAVLDADTVVARELRRERER